MTHTLKKNDRVETRRYEAGSNEYDRGTVVAVSQDGFVVRVFWEKSEEIYQEIVADLRRIGGP